MKKQLAAYVLKLNEAAQATKRAEDRPLYEKYLAVGFMIVFFLGSLDVGMVSGLEVAGLLIVGLMLLVNWLAVSLVVKVRNVA